MVYESGLRQGFEQKIYENGKKTAKSAPKILKMVSSVAFFLPSIYFLVVEIDQIWEFFCECRPDDVADDVDYS